MNLVEVDTRIATEFTYWENRGRGRTNLAAYYIQALKLQLS